MFVDRNGTVTAPLVDISSTLIGITYPHSASHRDLIVKATKNFTAASGTTNFLIKSPGPLQAHLEWSVISSGDVEIYFYEEPTVTGEGTDMTSARLFRESVKTTQTITKYGASVSAKGTLLSEGYNGGSGTGNALQGGSVLHQDAEWLPKVDSWYLLEVIRAASVKMNVIFEWYEVPEITL